MAMTTNEAEVRLSAALWSLPFRPFFLAASLWAALALMLWIMLLVTGTPLPSRFDPLIWHIHAMLFGFVLPAIAGFVLTAISNWTGRMPVRGAPLASLVVLWLMGRIACLISAALPFWLAAALDLAFPFVLCAVAAREIIAARNWRNTMIPVPIGVLGLADGLMHLEATGFGVPPGLGWRLAIVAITILISVIGGRIIPNFTHSWLIKRGSFVLPAPHDKIDRAALGALHAGMLGWAVYPASQLVGMLLLIAAALNLWRLARWRGLSTLSEPLLAILHLGYMWVIVGAAFLGTSLLSDRVPAAAAIHAFTAGAMGTMILAVMTRVSRGHTGRPLKADGVTKVIYGLITGAALSRVIAGLATGAFMQLIWVSAVLWIASFLLFAIAYGPILVSPRR